MRMMPHTHTSSTIVGAGWGWGGDAAWEGGGVPGTKTEGTGAAPLTSSSPNAGSAGSVDTARPLAAAASCALPWIWTTMSINQYSRLD
jgi:hypothetical protein